MSSSQPHHHRGISLIPILTLIGGLALAPQAQAFSGALSSVAGGIAGAGNWFGNAQEPVTVVWSVTETEGGWWHYAYTIEHRPVQTGRIILETSPTFTQADMFDAAGDFAGYTVGSFAPGADNPGLLGTIYGIRFDGAWGCETEIAFDSWNAPIWGDLYVRDDMSLKVNSRAWNAGFLEADPDAPAADGSLASHLLVPDTYGTLFPPIPEAATGILIGLGFLSVVVAARLRRRR
jgi:hypothetical protein